MALVIQLVDRMCNDCFKLKHLFLLSLDLVDILVKNVDELGSEHHVRTHINEPPCLLYRGKVNAIVLMKQQMRLISSSEDSHLVFWKLDKERETVSIVTAHRQL